jgi:hypothetical protein
MGGVILLADETQPTLMVLEKKKKCVSSKLAHHCYSLPLLLN